MTREALIPSVSAAQTAALIVTAAANLHHATVARRDASAANGRFGVIHTFVYCA